MLSTVEGVSAETRACRGAGPGAPMKVKRAGNDRDRVNR